MGGSLAIEEGLPRVLDKRQCCSLEGGRGLLSRHSGALHSDIDNRRGCAVWGRKGRAEDKPSLPWLPSELQVNCVVRRGVQPF